MSALVSTLKSGGFFITREGIKRGMEKEKRRESARKKRKLRAGVCEEEEMGRKQKRGVIHILVTPIWILEGSARRPLMRPVF